MPHFPFVYEWQRYHCELLWQDPKGGDLFSSTLKPGKLVAVCVHVDHLEKFGMRMARTLADIPC
jgi:hypothetical protein